LEIKGKNKEWLPRDLEVDSGAATTVLDISDLIELGYHKKECGKIYYRNANRKKTIAYGHIFTIKIGKHEIHDVPILFSAKLIAIPVLGRAKILEKIKIVFNNVEKRTVFSL
jgi:gag-polyprotein putative aspartyl protease